MTKDQKNNFAFFGTPALAVEILEALENAGHTPAVIVTMPDRPQRRGMDMKETAVAAWGRDRGIPVLKPEKLDSDFINNLQSTNDTSCFAIVVAYGKILPQTLLDMMPMYNIHYSLLPRWRGATPVESAILAGDAETGVAIQRMVHTLDAGPLVALEKTNIGETETAPALRARLNGIAKECLIRILPQLMEGSPTEEPQDESLVTHCGKIVKEDGLVSLSDSAETLDRKFRAYYGWPGVYTFFDRGGKRIRTIIVRAHREGNRFVIETVKPEGKGEVALSDYLRSGAKPV